MNTGDAMHEHPYYVFINLLESLPSYAISKMAPALVNNLQGSEFREHLVVMCFRRSYNNLLIQVIQVVRLPTQLVMRHPSPG